jgi:hypothetical protein
MHALAPFAALAVALVAAAWLRRTFVSLDFGIGSVDSLWYHLPFAARFAQDGSITSPPYTDLEFLNAFYPANVELLHAGGFLAFDTDALSPWLNLVGLALALLAGWCFGARRGAGPVALIAVALVYAVPGMFDSQAGEAKNDAFALAFMLASVALLLASRAPGPVLIAGLAAGLAVGTKLSLLAPIGAVTLLLVLPIRRWPVIGAWLGGLAIPSLAWYARNLFATGNPLPWMDLGPLPNPAEARFEHTTHALSEYLLDGDKWSDYFRPGLEFALGPWWWAVLALAAAGIVVALRARKGSDPFLALGVVALVSAVAYVFTPSTAAGPEGEPVAFGLNVRYLAPALLLGLCLLATVPPPGRARIAAASALGVTLVATQFADSIWQDEQRRKAIGLAVLALAAIAVVRFLRPPRALVFGGAVAAAAAALVGGWVLTHDYLRQEFTIKAYPYTSWAPFEQEPLWRWARSQHGARIAVIGTTGAFFQYPLTGPRHDNEVRALGEHGPHGSFTPFKDCRALRRELEDGGYTHLAVTADIDLWDPFKPRVPRELVWLDGIATRERVRGSRAVLYALPDEIGDAGCR